MIHGSDLRHFLRSSMVAVARLHNRVVLFAAGCVLLLSGWMVALVAVSRSLFLENDESFTVSCLDLTPLQMLHAVGADGTPPLHYMAVKAWSCVAGNDIASLRILSVALIAASLPLAFKLANYCVVGRSMPGWIAVVLTASAANIVVQATTARFYALAVVLVLLSHNALLDFLASGRRPAYWGIVAGLAMLAHHFALFSFIGQIGFVAGLVFVERRNNRDYAHLMRGLGVALTGAFATYSWWLPVFILQAKEVHADFWIPPINGEWTLHVLSYVMLSTTGLPVAIIGIALFAAVCFARIGCARKTQEPEGELGALNARRIDWYLLTQFVSPFVFCIGISILSGRSVLQERYLVMCQVSWVCLLARALGEGEMIAIKWIGVIVLCCTATVGVFHDVSLRRQKSLGAAESLKYLEAACLPSDVVITKSAWDLNVCRYYLGRHRHEVRLVQATVPITTNFGHQGHLSVLKREDMFILDDLGANSRWRRVLLWNGAESTERARLPPAYVKIGTRCFGEDDSAAFDVDEYAVK